MPNVSSFPSSRGVADVPKYEPASEYEAQFWNLLENFDLSVKNVKIQAEQLSADLPSNGKSPNVLEIDRIVDSTQKIISSINLITDNTKKEKESSLLLLSRRDDLARQIEESSRILLLNRKELKRNLEMANSQLLDAESEKSRRGIVNKALKAQKIVVSLRDHVNFLDCLLKKTPTTNTMQFSWTPRHVKGKVVKSETKIFFDRVKREYERTQNLDTSTKTLSRKVLGIQDTVQQVTSQKFQLSSAYRGKKKITPLPFSSPTSIRSHSKASKETVSANNALRSLTKNHAISAKVFNRNDLVSSYSCEEDPIEISKMSWRRNKSSQLMVELNTSDLSLTNISHQLAPAETRMSSLPPVSVRSAWNAKDAIAFESSDLSLPTTLKQIDATKACKQALVPFGVTPEKMLEIHEVKARERKSKTVAQSYSVPTISKKNYKTSATGNASVSFAPLESKSQIPYGGLTDGKKQMKSNSANCGLLSTEKKKESSKGITTSNSTLPVGFPPMSSKAPTPSGSGELNSKKQLKAESVPEKTLSNDSSSASTRKETKEVQLTRDSGLFGSLADLENTLSQSTEKPLALSMQEEKESRSAVSSSLAGSTGNFSYEETLTKFYEQHNKQKIIEVGKTLIKYKGREQELFSKLAKKYNVANPLDQSVLSSSESSLFAPTTSGEKSPFGASTTSGGKSPFESARTAPFGSPTPAPFGAPSSTMFGNTVTSPFGQSEAPSPATFGQSVALASASVPFGNAPIPGGSGLSSPFGQPGGSASTPFVTSQVNTSIGSAGNGPSPKTAREILVTFYQQRNPAKVSEVDKLLQKYAGQEEKLLRNLAAKYQIDPAEFGVAKAPTSAPSFSSTPAPFGQSSPMGMSGTASQGFGSLAKSTASTGFGAFGSSATSSQGGFSSFATSGGGGFGSSQAPQAPSFSSFGAPRR